MRSMIHLAMLAGLALGAVGYAQSPQDKQEGEASVASASKGVLQPGAAAPGFSLDSSTGSKVALGEQAGKIVVLYFYPKADTPGCTKEACGFRDALTQYKKESIVVLGVSPDPLADVQKFAKKYHLSFPLLADTDHSVCQAYGVWQQKGERMGVARTTFVIGKDGKIAKTFESVKPEGHDQEVLAWIKANVK